MVQPNREQRRAMMKAGKINNPGEPDLATLLAMQARMQPHETGDPWADIPGMPFEPDSLVAWNAQKAKASDGQFVGIVRFSTPNTMLKVWLQPDELQKLSDFLIGLKKELEDDAAKDKAKADAGLEVVESRLILPPGMDNGQ